MRFRLLSLISISLPAFADTVKGQPTADATQLLRAFDALAVTNIDDVRGNLFLPPKLSLNQEELEIQWESSNSSVITNDGVVFRQAADTQITLTAAVNHDGVQQQRSLIASVRKISSTKSEAFEGYAFVYFRGGSIADENIFFAASVDNDALRWNELNNGNPVLTSSQGSKGLRDPFVIRSPEGDKFYLIATDLSIGSGTSWEDAVRIGSRYLEIWESPDLRNWSAQRHVLVSPPTAGNTWAPEAYYDQEIGAYVVFWASSLYAEDDTSHSGSTYNRMLYATTRDFVTFSSPEIWQDAGMSRIDSTVIEVDGVYHRFTKDEGYQGTNCSDIIQESSSSLRASLPSWSMVDSCIGSKAGVSGVEGPTSFKANKGDANGEKYYLFVDEFGGRGYIPLETVDINKPSWTVSKDYALPKSPRHGTVISITAAELSLLSKNDPIIKRPRH